MLQCSLGRHETIAGRLFLLYLGTLKEATVLKEAGEN